MAIDYIIDRTCPVKDTLGTEGLIRLLKSRNRAGEIFRRLLEDGKTEPEALETSFSVQTYSGDTGQYEVKKVTVRDLFQETDQLKELAHHCIECPLNDGEGFGCYNVVTYPISGEAERWLVRLGEAAVARGLPDSILIKFILDEGVNGEFFTRLRQDKHRSFLELQAPLDIRVEKKLIKSIRVDTNQILDMMFAIGTMERTHQMFLVFFSSGVTFSREEPDPTLFLGNVQAAAVREEDDSVRYWVYNLPPAPSDDHSITQIKRYFRSVFAAFATGDTISVDY